MQAIIPTSCDSKYATRIRPPSLGWECRVQLFVTVDWALAPARMGLVPVYPVSSKVVIKKKETDVSQNG